ncbi:MAG: MgtC/SapB family protein [Acidobacteriaceae bacterium]|nr:MgtC/SapB family protein [Acidobacteriaceae bacterium]
MVWHHFTLDLAIALLLGAIIGAERQWHQRIAGLRTNSLVAAGSAMFVSITYLVPLNATSLQIAAQVVSGIGFLGAGVIMREGLTIRGLNTAATLWCSAAVGALCGLGFIREALIAAAGVVGVNLCLRPIARRIDARTSHASDAETVYVFRFTCRTEDEAKERGLLMHLLHGLPLALRALHSEDLESPGRVEVRATLISSERENAMLEKIVQRLSLEPGITAVSWEAGELQVE